MQGAVSPSDGKDHGAALLSSSAGLRATCKSSGSFLGVPPASHPRPALLSTPRHPELLLFIQRTPPAPHCCPTPLWLPQALPPPCTLTLWTLLGTPKMSTHFSPSPTRGRSIPSSLLTPYLRREKGREGGCWHPDLLRGASWTGA